MSGGLIGPIGMTGVAGAAVIGAAFAIGATVKVTADITKMGSIAAYEQIKLATECTDAVKDAKRQRERAVVSYQNDSRRALSELNNSMNFEITRLKSKLERAGKRVNLSELGSEANEILLSLIFMDQRLEGTFECSKLRIPGDIYRSITELIDPLFIYIPAGDSAFNELTKLKRSATLLVKDNGLTATEKSRRLIEIESALISRLEEFRSCSKRYEYYLAQFTSLSFANERLSEACGCLKLDLTFDPGIAKEQIEKLSLANVELRKRLHSKMRKDDGFVAANRELAGLVIKSVQDAGLGLVGVSEQEYGTSAMFAYKSSLLKATVSRDGILSIDVVGRKDESIERIKEDESVFCENDLKNICRMFEKNGLTMQIDRICNLTSDSILYEDDVDMPASVDDNRWSDDADNLQALYINHHGGGN